MAQKHAMLSYEWTVQKLALRVYDYLIKSMPVWIDIKAGITSANLFEGLSQAIENSACFVCFMTPEYQTSDFCRQELQYAMQCKIPIIPLKLVKDWNPTSWLGFITAGLLWMDFYHINNFERKAEQLCNRIVNTAGDQLQMRAPDVAKSVDDGTPREVPSPRPQRFRPAFRSDEPLKEFRVERSDVHFRQSDPNLSNQPAVCPRHGSPPRRDISPQFARGQNRSPARMPRPPRMEPVFDDNHWGEGNRKFRIVHQRPSTTNPHHSRHRNGIGCAPSVLARRHDEEEEKDDAKFGQ